MTSFQEHKSYGRAPEVHHTRIKLADLQGRICGVHKKNEVQQQAEFCQDWASGIAKGHENTAKAKLQLLALTANFKNQKTYLMCNSDFFFFFCPPLLYCLEQFESGFHGKHGFFFLETWTPKEHRPISPPTHRLFHWTWSHRVTEYAEQSWGTKSKMQL